MFLIKIIFFEERVNRQFPDMPKLVTVFYFIKVRSWIILSSWLGWPRAKEMFKL